MTDAPWDVMFEKIVLSWTEKNKYVVVWKKEQGKGDIEDYLMMTSIEKIQELYCEALKDSK